MSDRDTFNDGSGRMPARDELQAACGNYRNHAMILAAGKLRRLESDARRRKQKKESGK